MEEDESYKLRSQYLSGAVDALVQCMAAMVRELPEKAMEAVASEAEAYASFRQIEADDSDRDDLRDRASAAFEVARHLRGAVDFQSGELAAGKAVRTIQPFHP